MNSFLKFSKRFSSLKEIPEPKLLSGIKNKIFGHFNEIKELSDKNKNKIYLEVLDNKIRWYEETKSNIFKLRFFNNYLIFSKCPDFNKMVLTEKTNDFGNGSPTFNEALRFFLPEAIIIVEGEKWVRIRKISQRAINKTNLDLFIPALLTTTQSLFKNYKVNEEQTIELSQKLVFDSFHIVMYGWDPKILSHNKQSLEILNHFVDIIKCIQSRFFDVSPLLWKLPTSKNRKINHSNSVIKNFIVNFVKEQMTTLNENSKPSLLREMLLATKSNENDNKEDRELYMTPTELYDTIAFFFIGAFDTTSLTLKTILYYLAKYPNYQEKLRKEILNFYKDKDFSKTNMQELNSIEYLTYFIDEVNRLSASAPMVSRYAKVDTEVNGYKIKKNADLILDWASIVLNPDNFGGQTDLNEFRPDRWGEFRPHIYKSIFPFGQGGRMCPGKMIALAELKVFLSFVIQKYKIVLRNPDEKLEYDIGIVIGIKNNVGNVNFIEL